MADDLVDRLRDAGYVLVSPGMRKLAHEAAARIKYLEKRLEVAPGWGEAADCISCRDDTIKLQDARIEALEAALAEVGKELADTKLRLSHMATMYSDAVDIFGTGFSGYDAVLRGQAQRRIFRETGLMPKKADVMPEHERRPDHHEWAAEKSAIQFSLAEAEGRVKAITIAMHDAIRRPMGVVPETAEPFYQPALASDALLDRQGE